MKKQWCNKMIKIAIIAIIVIVGILLFFVCSNAKADTSKLDKHEEEIEYLDTKITSLINDLNGLNLQNYRITVTKVEEAEENVSTESSNKENSQKEENREEDESSKQTTITKMEQEQAAIGTKEVKWEWMQGQVEVFYSVWVTIILDLYEIGVDAEKILGFSNTLDNVSMSIAEKNKEKTAANLAALYQFLPDFANKTNIDELKKDAIQTKSYILNAYAFVQGENWDKVQEEVGKAEKHFIDRMNHIQKEDSRKFNINKNYILIEEMKNSLSTKDKQIFYVKYKNLIEELNLLF